MRICTIVARNYLGHPEVLADSFREHHPSGKVTVLVVDDRERLVVGCPGRATPMATTTCHPSLR